MSLLHVRRVPNRAHRLLALLAASCAALLLATAVPVMGSEIVRVEEDWELVVSEPDPNSQSPQVTCVISPKSNVDGVYAAFDLNHQSLPEFHSGGMQLQVWDDHEEIVNVANLDNNDALDSDNETITWTQKMELADGQLRFAVANGSSQTWGGFGGEQLQSSIASSLNNLNQYDPNVSVENSGVGFASNRVTSLVLKRVRLYSAAGLVSEDTNPRTVFPHE